MYVPNQHRTSIGVCGGLFCVQWFERWLFCWYLWNCWPSLFKLSFHSIDNSLHNDYRCDKWSRNCLTFRSTCVQPRFLWGSWFLIRSVLCSVVIFSSLRLLITFSSLRLLITFSSLRLLVTFSSLRLLINFSSLRLLISISSLRLLITFSSLLLLITLLNLQAFLITNTPDYI